MLRRVHVANLLPGVIQLGPSEAHHARDVLRLTVGSSLEVFDAAGRWAVGTIEQISSAGVAVEIERINEPLSQPIRVTVVSAVPKGDRADWMIEKLAELGVWRFVPLATERSVVHPSGRNKIERWERTAIESAKQSRRAGVMEIAALTQLDDAIRSTQRGWYLSIAAGAISIRTALGDVFQNPQAGSEVLRRPGSDSDAEESGSSENLRTGLGSAATAMRSLPNRALNDLALFIGPEGGWSDSEMKQMDSAGFTAVALTSTVLRVETAAIVAAALVLVSYGNSLTVQ